MPLLLIFIILPAIELTLFIKIGAQVGAIPILLEIILTAVIGLSVMRKQGLSTLTRANEKLNRGETPAKEVAEGFLLGISGLFIVLPGILTDVFGICLLIPFIRKSLASKILAKSASGQSSFRFYSQHQRSQTDAHTFEGEFSRDEPIDGHIEHKKK